MHLQRQDIRVGFDRVNKLRRALAAILKNVSSMRRTGLKQSFEFKTRRDRLSNNSFPKQNVENVVTD